MTSFITQIFPGLTPRQLMAKLNDPEEAAYALSCLKFQAVRASSIDTAAQLAEVCNVEFEFNQSHLDRYLPTRPPIPLQLDGVYFDRTGRRHGPLVAGGAPHLDYPFRDPISNICWMANGHYYAHDVQNLKDLIEETF